MAAQAHWVQLSADNFTATVAKSSITSHVESHLANMLELQLAKGSSEIRLDCDAATAKEVVSALRQGASYVAPSDARLLAAVKHQLDFLGIPMQRGQGAAGLEVVWVPCYHTAIDDQSQMQNDRDCKPGLLMYSTSARGWANLVGTQDPRPMGCVEDFSGVHPYCGDYASAVLRTEDTGAGADVVYLVRNKGAAHFRAQQGVDAAVINVGTFQSSKIAQPPLEVADEWGSALTAAQGNLYLLGGTDARGRADSEFLETTPFQIYDPRLNAWFEAAQPGGVMGDTFGLSGHCLVSNQQESMLLAVGGITCTHGDDQHFGKVLMYDLTAGKWAANPSGCTWHRVQSTEDSVSAVAVDPYTIMVLSREEPGDGERLRRLTEYVDLLDLRMWRWRDGATLQVSTGSLCFSRGVVYHNGVVLAVGGCGESDSMSSQAHAYDPRNNTWVEYPALPFPIYGAQPLVVRMTNALPAPE